MEVWRLAVGVTTWRHGGMELGRLVTGVATWKYRGTKRSGGLEVWALPNKSRLPKKSVGCLKSPPYSSEPVK